MTTEVMASKLKPGNVIKGFGRNLKVTKVSENKNVSMTDVSFYDADKPDLILETQYYNNQMIVLIK